MTVEAQIAGYIAGQAEPKRSELQELHERILRISPDAQLWFLDGRNEDGKVVSNPNIGYGQLTIAYAGGKTREFYRIGLSANTTGISLYVMGIADRNIWPKPGARRSGRRASPAIASSSRAWRTSTSISSRK